MFYQKCWDVVDPSVIRFVLDFFQTGILPPETNDAMLVLIAKVIKPERITQFRPIILCNVLFKTITKTMVLEIERSHAEAHWPSPSQVYPREIKYG